MPITKAKARVLDAKGHVVLEDILSTNVVLV